MIVFKESQWLDQGGQLLDQERVEQVLLQLEKQIGEKSVLLSQLLLKAIYYLVSKGQEFALSTQVISSLSSQQVDFLEEFLEDVLEDLGQIQEDMQETVAEIEDLVAEKNDLEEDYLDGLGHLEDASTELMNKLSGQVLVLTELDKEIGEMLAERQRLEEEQASLEGRLSQLLTEILQGETA